MNIAKEVRALIAAAKKGLSERPCDFYLRSHNEDQSLTEDDKRLAQKHNTPILIKKHDGSFMIYGKLAGSSWMERSLNDLTDEQKTALLELDFSQSTLKFDESFAQKPNLISAVQKGHSATIYEQSVDDMFSNLLYAGIPELRKEPIYYPVYKLYAKKEDIPAEKKAGDIYLYIQDGQLHYQTQWILDDSEQEASSPVYTGIIDIPAVDLKLLLDVVFVDNSVKLGDAVRTLWYDRSEDGCIYSVIDDSGKKRVGLIVLEAGCNLRDKLLKKIQEKKYCLDKSVHLKKSEEIIGEAVQDAGHMQPFYENRYALLQWYKEICNIETKFLDSAKDLGEILCKKDFTNEFVEKEDLNLIGKLKQNLSKIIASQVGIQASLVAFENSFQLIDYLKKAYGPAFEATLYSEMTTLMAKFDGLLQQYSPKINEFFKECPDAKDPNKLPYFLVLANLTVRFSAQYVLRRQMLFNALADYIAKGHKKFHELAPMYSAVNKSAFVANKAKDGFLVDKIRNGKEDTNQIGLEGLFSIIANEKDHCKKLILRLIQPIWTLLVLDTQSAMENGHTENKVATFYMQRRILVEQLEKFKKEWNLLADDANIVVNVAIAAIIEGGCKLVAIEEKDGEINYRIQLKEGFVIEGIIETKDLNYLEILQEPNLNDACFTANILYAIAKKGGIPMPDNEDIAALLRAVTSVIDILSPENCSLPLDNTLSSRRNTMHLSRPESKLKDRDMGLNSIASPAPPRSSTSVDGRNGRKGSFFFSQKFSRAPVLSDDTTSKKKERSLSTTPPEVVCDVFSSSPASVDYGLSTTPPVVSQRLSYSSEEEADRSSPTSPLEVNQDLEASASSSETVGHRLSSDEEKRSPSPTVVKDDSNGKNKKTIFSEKVLIKKQSGFFEREEINVDVMRKLCMEENDCNAFYYLACAARDGRYGVPKDLVAAYYLACLAEKYLPAAEKNEKGKKLVGQLILQLPPVTSIDKECKEAFKNQFRFDPKEEYFRTHSKHIIAKPPNASF